MKYKIDEGSVHHAFLSSRAPIQLFGGGYGNGKTAALCVKCIQLALGYPGSNGLIGRSTYAKLNDTIRKEFYKWLPSNLIARMPTTTDNTLILTNNSTINFRYIAQRGKKTFDSNTTSNLLSATFDWAAIDQIEDPEIEYKDFLDILGRMRGTTPYKGSDRTMPFIGPGFLMLATNPTGNWVYTKLVKPLLDFKSSGRVSEELLFDTEANEPIIELFEAPTYANQKNLPPAFLKKLEATYKGQMRDRFLLGKWASYEGLVYPDFEREIHMIPQAIMMNILVDRWRERNKYTAVEGFDYGSVSPSCYLLGFTDALGRLFIVDGFYEPGLTTKQVYNRISDIRMRYDGYLRFSEPMWADPAIFKKTQVIGETITTIAKQLQDFGLYIKPGQNAIASGIAKVSGYLALQDNNGLLDPTIAAPNIYFSDMLEFIPDEFLAYFWKKNAMGDRIDEPVDRNDHAMDALKYLVSRLPDPADLIYAPPQSNQPRYLQGWHEPQ